MMNTSHKKTFAKASVETKVLNGRTTINSVNHTSNFSDEDAFKFILKYWLKADSEDHCINILMNQEEIYTMNDWMSLI